MLLRICRASAKRCVRSLSHGDAQIPLYGVVEDGLIPGGMKASFDWRCMFEHLPERRRFSPWHDVTLFPVNAPHDNGVWINYVNEIPRGTARKLEMNKNMEHNPIQQDKCEDGELRFFKYGPIPFNYGFVPQTWEDPSFVHADVGYGGDNDPVDVVEVGSEPLPVGAILPVKVLGLLALIDEDECDWKLLAVRKGHPLARCAEWTDVLRGHPALQAIVTNWFENYKVADGKAQNRFAMEGRVLPALEALQVIKEAHKSWKGLFEARGQSPPKRPFNPRQSCFISTQRRPDTEEEEKEA